jgi:hypothetical protein
MFIMIDDRLALPETRGAGLGKIQTKVGSRALAKLKIRGRSPGLHVLRFVPPKSSPEWFRKQSNSLKTLAKQVRHLDKESTAIAAKPWLKLARKWIEPAAIEIVVVTYVESGAWTGRVAQQKLSFIV